MEQQGFQIRDVATFSLAFALLALAVAIAYFAYEIGKVREQVPEILAQVESTSNEIGPVVSEISDIRELIPPILEEVAATRDVIPSILEEVAATREVIPPILEQVEETRKIVPPILAEVEQTRKQIPDVLKSVDNVSWAVVQTTKEMKALRPVIPEVIAQIDATTQEIEATRNSIPPTLDRLDLMIERARVAGREASEGAVTGIFTGILTAPFRLVGGMGSMVAPGSEAAKYFSERDYELMREAVRPLSQATTGFTQSWQNPESDTRGNLTLVQIYKYEGTECRDIKNQAWKGADKIYDDVVTFCMNGDGTWQQRDVDLDN